MKLDDSALVKVEGGALSATLLNSFARAVNTILDLGRAVGSSIRRIYSKNYC